jgi:hypothetical protein
VTVKATEQTTDELRRHDTSRDPGASQTTGGPGGSGFAAVLGAPVILALQRSAGNRATTAWIESQREASASALHRSKSARWAPISVQRRLLSQTSDALQAAKEHNAALFGTLSSVVDRYVPDDEQKKINNVEPASMKVSNFFAKIGRSLARTPANGQDERAGLLTKLVRAVIYHEYVDRIEPLENSKDLDPREKAKTRSRYFERTLLNRDKQAGLLRKGVSSAEAQAFLQQWGLLADQAKATEEESSSQLKNAPRVDVRSTFIGGPKLGINVRAHL